MSLCYLPSSNVVASMRNLAVAHNKQNVYNIKRSEDNTLHFMINVLVSNEDMTHQQNF